VIDGSPSLGVSP